MKWSIRNLLNPVITRVLLFGTNSIDLEYVLREVEKAPLLNGKALEETWCREWCKKADRFIELANNAKEKNNMHSMYEYNMLAAQCYYACYMINSEDIEKKKEVYGNLSKHYKMAMESLENKSEIITIPMKEGDIYAYLHLPKIKKEKYPCVILFSGIGSCKEELEMLARPLIERGVAVLSCDSPGVGDSLFKSNLQCKPELVEESFSCILNKLTEIECIDEQNLATYGLCMGGAFAYRMAATYSNVKCCSSLFPLFFEYLSNNVIPKWMRAGKWASFQYGEMNDGAEKAFFEGMAKMSEKAIECDYFLVHSVYDNWMKLEELEEIFNRSKGNTKKILIEEEPVYATKEAVMHAMPVGEQMHWIKHVVADWMIEKLEK